MVQSKKMKVLEIQLFLVLHLHVSCFRKYGACSLAFAFLSLVKKLHVSVLCSNMLFLGGGGGGVKNSEDGPFACINFE